MLGMKRMIICFLIAFPFILSAQINPGIYRLDYRYKEEVKWSIGEYSIEIIKNNGTVEYMSLSEDGSCLTYESKSRWTYTDNLLHYKILSEKYRDDCSDEFMITSPEEDKEIFEIIVIRDNYFIGHSQEDENLFMRWVLLEKNPIKKSMLK